MFVTALYKVYVFWTFYCTGNKTFMKVYQWFYWTSNPQLPERSQPVPWALTQSCSGLQKFHLDAMIVAMPIFAELAY